MVCHAPFDEGDVVGTTILHYRVNEKLGEGGMGIVYKAFDTKLQRYVALKFLPMFVTPDSEESARFLHEVHALSSLNHPNIATLYDLEEDDHQRFIVLEYIEGETLHAKIRQGQLSIQQVIKYAIEIADGLEYAHNHDVIHRDIKSENIMITKDDRAKITDFGLAKLKGTAKVTRTSSTVGTAGYMSPEQARGEEVDAKTDIWSFGVMLYEMITGQLPFRGDFEAAILYSVINDTPTPGRVVRPDIPGELDVIIEKTLQKERDKRYQRTEELVFDLKALQEKERKPSGTAFDPGAIHYFQPGLLKKNRILIISTGLAAIISILLLSQYFGFWRKQEATPHLALDIQKPDTVYLSHVITNSIDSLQFRNLIESGKFRLTPLSDSLIESLENQLLADAIATFYPMVILTADEADRRLAKRGLLTKMPNYPDPNFFLGQLGCSRSITIYACKIDPKYEGQPLLLFGEFMVFRRSKRQAPEQEGGNWVSPRPDQPVANIENIHSIVKGWFNDFVDFDKKKSLWGTILSVTDDRVILRLRPQFQPAVGALVKVMRSYSHNDTGFTQWLQDCKAEIEYCTNKPGWTYRISNAKEEYETIKRRFETWKNTPDSSKVRSGQSGMTLDIEITVTDVFDTTAIGVIKAKKWPWLHPRAGDRFEMR